MRPAYLTEHRFISIGLGVLCVFLLATYPTWHPEIDDTGQEREVKPFTSQLLTGSLCGLLAAAILLALISSLWQHVAAVAFQTIVQDMAYGSVRGEVGAAAIVLGWGSLVLYIVAFIVMLLYVLSVRILDALADD